MSASVKDLLHCLQNNPGTWLIKCFFDFTTGIPVIPASSLKGVLRSVFPKKSERYKSEKEAYIRDLLKDDIIDVYKLEEEIFDGLRDNSRISFSQRDIFFDAQIVKSLNAGNKIFGDDFITPHREELKNPIPLKFLKVLPEVVFKFQFDLKENGLI